MSSELERKWVKPAQISKHLFCCICNEIFKSPTRLKCSHTFCEHCISIWLQTQKTCPICRTNIKIKRFEKDLIASKIIEDFEVYCIHEQFCRWKGKLEHLVKHVENCEFRHQNVRTWLEEIEKIRGKNGEGEIEKKNEIAEQYQYIDDELQERINEEIPKGSLFSRLLLKDENSKALVLGSLGNPRLGSNEKEKKVTESFDLIDDLLKFASDPGTPNEPKEESTKFYSMEKEIKSENLSENKNELELKENDLTDGIFQNLIDDNHIKNAHINNDVKSSSFSLKEKILEFNNNEPEEVNKKKRKINNNSLYQKMKRIKPEKP